MHARRLIVLPCLVALVVLAGCGGGGQGGPRPAPAALGPWTVRDDPADAGLRAGWQRDPRLAGMRRVALPHVAHAGDAQRLAGRAAQRAFDGSVAWYRTTLTVRRAGAFDLRFASAHRDATVWVDGRRVCRHSGAYVPFACPVRLAAGRHDVAVRVDWRSPARSKAAGLDRAWYPWGGLNGAVTVAPDHPVVLEAPRVRTRLLDGGKRAVVDVTVDIAAHGGGGFSTLRGSLDGHALAFRPVAAGTARATVTLDHPPLWSPGAPHLVRLDLDARGAAPLRVRAGLREIGTRGGVLRLNGAPLRLQGASLPTDADGRGDALTPADDARIVAQLQALGANAARAQAPLSDDLLGRLDAAGILVWQEAGPFDPAGAWSSTTPELRRRATRRVLDTAGREAIHPSVLTWSLVNEASGDGHDGGQAAWIDATAQLLHRVDPGRPVAGDLWGEHLPHVAGLLHRHLDLLGFTSYLGWYEQLGGPTARQDATFHARVARLRRLFADRPLIATEVGAAGNRLNPAGQPGSEDFQAALVGHQARLARRNPALSGVLVFTLRDYVLHPGFRGGSAGREHPALRFADALNEKGLYRYDGSPKPAAAVVRAALSGR